MQRWSFGRFELGLSEDEFWGLGLNEFNSLTKRFEDKERRADYRALLISCTLINVILRPDPPVQPEDYLPQEPKPPQTPKEQLHILRVLNEIYGGVVVKGGRD